MIELFLLMLVISSSRAIFQTKECPCGYGGFCFNWPGVRSCDECETISNGWYKNDCNTIVDHCQAPVSPCTRGECVSTPGGFYCKCPIHYTGTACNIDWREYHHSSQHWSAPSNEVFVYYQIQPKPGASRTFTVMYDVDEKEFEERKVTMTISVSDGREYYPKLKHFARRDVHDECVKEAEQYPDLLDLRICDKIPKGSIMAFTFDPSLVKTEDSLLYVVGLKDPVCRTGIVSVIVFQPDDLGKRIQVFNQEFVIFTYFHPSRAPFNCMLKFTFNGCSFDRRYPVLQPRGSSLKITVERPTEICTGGRILKRAWYHQSFSNKLSQNNDPIPVVLEDEDKEILRLPPFFLNSGHHLFVFELTVQGNPPHYGGINTFTKMEHCFVETVMGRVNFRLQGGSHRTFSCLNPFEVKWENINRNMHLSEMLFYLQCDHASDPVCLQRQIQDPVIRQNRPAACDETYIYILTVQVLGANSTFTATIKFKPQDVQLGIRCSRNCDPVHPNFLSIWVAYTTPYIRGSVKWAMSLGDKKIDTKRARRLVRSFQPDEATRIYVTKPDVLFQPLAAAVVQKLRITVFHGEFLFAGSNGTVHQNDRYVNLFELVLVKNEVQKYEIKKEYKLIYPFYYFVFLIDDPTQGAIMLVRTNHLNIQTFVPYWSLISLCGHDPEKIFSCSTVKSVIATGTAEVNAISDLIKLQSMGKVEQLLRGANYLVWRGLTSSALVPYQWEMSLADRRTIVRLIEQAISIYSEEVDLLTVLHTLSMIFYSTNGVKAEAIDLEFVGEIDGIAIGIQMFMWLWMRDEASNCLLTVVKALYYHGQNEGLRYLFEYPHGDILERFMFTFSLAHAQAIDTYAELLQKDFVSYILINEIGFSAHSNKRLLEHILLMFAKTVASYRVLYAGVETYGHETVKLWTVNDSYVGLVDSVNKSTGEDWKFFGASSPTWYTRINLELPVSPFGLQYRELTLTAVAMKNRQIDDYQSPIVILLLKTRDGFMKYLPAGQEFRMTLPAMEKGQLLNVSRRKEKFRDTIERQISKYNYYTVYKMIFPKQYSQFSMAIYLSTSFRIKVKARLDRIPDYKEVYESPEVEIKKDEVQNVFVSIISILPDDRNLSLPNSVYLGILPSEELPIGFKLEISMFTDLKVCRTRDIDTDQDIGDCERVVNGSVWDDLNIICRCKLLGITAVHGAQIKMIKFIVTYVPFLESFAPPTTILEIAIGTVIIAFLPSVALGVAYFSDRRRRAKEILIFTKDYFRNNTYVFVIGVYTGRRVGAGTISTVAVQLQCRKGISKVIVLRPTRPENQGTLHRGKDDWFVIPTGEYLGSVTEVYVWHNFHCSSPWYCSQILIYDGSTSLWFRAQVEQWFTLYESNHKSRVAMFKADEYHAAERFEIQNFIDGFWVEFENTHHTFSVFEMHRRVLFTREQRTTIIVLKLLTMFSWIVFSQEVLHEAVFGLYYDPVESKQLIDLRLDTILMASIVSVLSTISVMPLELLYRIGHLSRVIQKRTTNNLRLMQKDVLMKDNRRSTHFSMRSRKSHVSRKSHTTSENPASGWLSFKIKYCSWSIFQDAFLSPCQFYLVDAKTDVLDFKMHSVTIISRCTAGFIVLAVIALVYYLMWGTHYAQKVYTTVALVLITLAMDSLVVNPSYILIRSFFMFYFLEIEHPKVSLVTRFHPNYFQIVTIIVGFIRRSVFTVVNWEYKYEITSQELVLLNEDTKYLLHEPLSYRDYITMATGKNYKPQLSSEIEKMKQLDYLKRVTIETLFLILEISAASVCIIIYLTIHNPLDFYGVRAMEWMLGPQVNREFGSKWINQGMELVHTPQAVSTYILFNYVQMEYKFSSGKYISLNEKPWARDLSSRPTDAAMLIFLFMANGSTNMPNLFEEYFNPPSGYLSDGEPYTQPLVLDEKLLHYHEQSEAMKGLTGATYEFKGHNVSLPIANLRSTTGRLRFTFEDLQKITVPLRALFFSINFINAFTKQVFTVDLLVEYLPSGLAAPRLEVNTSLIKPRSIYLLELYALLAIWILMIIIIFIGLHNSYYEALWKKLVKVPILLVVLVLNYNDYKMRFNTMERIIYNPNDNYLDLHAFYKNGFLSNLTLLFMPFAVVHKCIWNIRSLVGTNRFKRNLVSCLHSSLAFCVFGCFMWLLILQAQTVKENLNLVSYIMTHFYSKSYIIEWKLRRIAVGISIVLVVVFNRVCSSLIIHEYLYNDMELAIDRNNLFIRMITTFKREQSRPEKKKHHSWFHFRRDSAKSKTIELTKSKTESDPNERTSQASVVLHEKFRFIEGLI